MVTWFYAAYFLWDTMFHRGTLTFFGSKKEADSHALVNRAAFIYRNLPDFLQHLVPAPKGEKDHTSSNCALVFPTMDSRIMGVAQGPDQLRQHTASNYFCDEGAFQDQLRATLQAALPMARRIVVVSSANPGAFYDLYRGGSEEEKDFIPQGEGVGLRTGDNGFHILRLHYTAHPDRRDPEWKKNARRAYQPHEWEQEQEISFTARGGEKVLTPPFDRARHVIPHFIPPPDWPMGLSVDPGYRNPMAACLYALDYSDNVYKVDEIYAKGLHVAQATDLILALLKKYERPLESLAWCVIDNEAKKLRQGMQRSLQDQYQEHGIYFSLAPRVTDEEGHNLIRSYLQNTLSEQDIGPKGPGLYYMENCRASIQEVINLAYTSTRAEDLNLPEKAEDKDNHTIDADKNFLSLHPRYRTMRNSEKERRQDAHALRAYNLRGGSLYPHATP